MNDSRIPLGFATAAVTTAAVTAAAVAALAAPSTALAAPAPSSHAVFVQTNGLGGNSVMAYRQGADGRLSLAHTYATGGRGGILDGAVADHLASQGSLTYDAAHQMLYAVNAGSDTVSVFAVDGTALRLVQVVRSGGRFPVSVAVHGLRVYVLNAEGHGPSRASSSTAADWRRSRRGTARSAWTRPRRRSSSALRDRWPSPPMAATCW